MVYPKMRGKHLEKPVFSTKEFLKYREKFGVSAKTKQIEAIILCFSRRLVDRINKIHKISEIPDLFGNFGKLYQIDGTDGKVGILVGFGIGAPATVMVMEETIAFGAKKFVVLGTAGGIGQNLDIGDIVVCPKSIRDEGTSHHYVKQSKFAFASPNLTKALYQSLKAQKPGRAILHGPSWTTDAPYRETVAELKRYRSQGVMTVEMEASAVFAVGRVKKVETGAVFVVSDILSEKSWKPAFRSEIVLENLSKAFISVRDVLAASTS
jgi:uridine phosphorylase